MNPFRALLLATALLASAVSPCRAAAGTGEPAANPAVDALRPRVRALLAEACHVPADAELEVAALRVASGTPDLGGALSWRLAPGSAPSLAPRLAVRLEGWSQGRKDAEIVVWADLRVWRDVWVVSRAIDRQSPVGDAVALERRDVCGLPRKAFAGDLPGDGWITLESLRPGAVVLEHQVAARPVVQKGGAVVGVFEQGTLSIRVQLVALEPGAAGQAIRVRNATSGKTLKAKVIDEKTVRIL